MNLVIDASMALAWIFERQRPERATRLLAACGEQPWWVPALWHLEISNALLVAERRGVIEASACDLFLGRLQALPFHCDQEQAQDRRSKIVALGRSHGLSSYDASYLELAHRLGASLASFDRKLNKAAESLELSLLF